MTPACFLAAFARTACSGQLVRAHLIPKRLLKQAWAETHHEDLRNGQRRLTGKQADLIWDERSWVWACGGPMGNAGHHGELDHARSLRISRAALPPAVEELAAELDALLGREMFGVWLDREYGPRAVAGEES